MTYTNMEECGWKSEDDNTFLHTYIYNLNFPQAWIYVICV